MKTYYLSVYIYFIGNCTSLQELCLNVNKLVEMPREIGKLINLRKLLLNGNNSLIKLPVEMQSLVNLKQLWVDYQLNDQKRKLFRV